jgi:hypothetical protein
MNIYHIWCNLKAGVSDLEFCARTRAYLEQLQSAGRLAAFRITRAKLGLRPPALREFHIMLEFEDLAQLDSAFGAVAARTDPVEQFHHAVNSLVQDVMFALYRDFPDSVRVHGQERF